MKVLTETLAFPFSDNTLPRTIDQPDKFSKTAWPSFVRRLLLRQIGITSKLHHLDEAAESAKLPILSVGRCHSLSSLRLPAPLNILHRVEVNSDPSVHSFAILQLSASLVQEGGKQRVDVLKALREDTRLTIAIFNIPAKGTHQLRESFPSLAAVARNDGSEPGFGCFETAFEEEVLVEFVVLFSLLEGS
jgi:hypothetical protein